ncbi:BTAD domain-containing putative transcriptional regulator [Dactylosporangium sp. AC04546]|uniref:BTAD domain-containing putative transcriptional regulator n=1 Tax=Dactylosporangium sp. AC04546 TaxID=2862460 RepID=UPI001EDE17C8|nr:BTAD domain-containing putative transcriptional regulator [Dactylosporangium sp. AC04546]WVK82402.1 BTAD domain-containing putative transcriptional regulator [Dactylosporangium sp. AC04546]
MRVGLLGPLTVEAGGRPVEVGGARLRTLLVRLAVEPGRLVPVDQLADALWPANPPTDPANAVQSLVSRLRKALGDPDALVSVPGGYRLDAGEVDAARFERLTAEGRRALRAGDHPAAAHLLREALALWRGPALADVTGAPFAEPLTARWEELRLTATEDLAEAGGEVPELQELVAAHPLRERLVAVLISRLHADGRQAEALAAFEECRRRLADELGVDPSPALREAHLAVLRAQRPAPARSGNLRAALTSFVGRDGDVERLSAQILDGRLVTLVGPGGAGKTRLATTVAAASGGAWLVELAPVTEAGEVPATVLRTLIAGGLVPGESPHRPRRQDTVDQLADALTVPGVLLLLDNCEHVVDAVARLSEELLGRCPKLHILATSREPLGILGEQLFPVGPLAHPGDAVPADVARASPAVQLLADRAAAVRPGFAVTDDNVGAVVEICRRLDGLPLAVELAAARLRSFTAEQVAARLDDRFRLLTGGSRTALPRHRTLHAVVAWSWELLGEPERRFAEALAVFPGGFDAPAAAAVAGVPDADEHLDALVDRSLLQVVSVNGGVRYRMLETIREFALEELARRGGVAQARAAHAAHFLARLEEAEPYLRTGAQVEWLERLRPERDNVHAAVAHFCETGDAVGAYRIGAAAAWLWTFEDTHTEAAASLDRIRRVPGDVPAGLRVVVLAVHLVNSGFAGDFVFADDELDGLVTLAATVPPAGAHPFVSLIEPVVAMFRDDSEAGAAAVAERLRQPIDAWSRAMLLSILGHMRENDGDIAGMQAALEESAAEFREVGERWGLSMTVSSLADAYARRGELTAAVAGLEESIRLHRELGISGGEGYQRIRVAALRARTAGPEVARAELCAFVEDPAAAPRDVSHAMLELGHLARGEGDLDDAGRRYAEAWRLQVSVPLVAPQYRAVLHLSHAHVHIERGEFDAARGRLDNALDLALPVRDMPVVARVAVGHAALALAERQPERGAEILGAAELLAGGADRSDPDWLRTAARLRAALGAAFDEAHARGLTMPRADALSLLG